MSLKEFAFCGSSVVLTENNHYQTIDQLARNQEVSVWDGASFVKHYGVFPVGRYKFKKLTASNNKELVVGKNKIQFSTESITEFLSLSEALNTTNIFLNTHTLTSFRKNTILSVEDLIADAYVFVSYQPSVVMADGFLVYNNVLLKEDFDYLTELSINYLDNMNNKDCLIELVSTLEKAIDMGRLV